MHDDEAHQKPWVELASDHLPSVPLGICAFVGTLPLFAGLGRHSAVLRKECRILQGRSVIKFSDNSLKPLVASICTPRPWKSRSHTHSEPTVSIRVRFDGSENLILTHPRDVERLTNPAPVAVGFYRLQSLSERFVLTGSSPSSGSCSGAP
jgi:hypothetical protein